MSTLAEIEAAAQALPVAEKEELVRLLRRQLESERTEKPRHHTNLADFAGVLQLSEDPMVWQEKVRSEWK